MSISNLHTDVGKFKIGTTWNIGDTLAGADLNYFKLGERVFITIDTTEVLCQNNPQTKAFTLNQPIPAELRPEQNAQFSVSIRSGAGLTYSLSTLTINVDGEINIYAGPTRALAMPQLGISFGWTDQINVSYLL